MQVWKFGGTSVGKPERMHSIRNLITEDPGRKIVVLSALSGTTNSLISIGESLKANNDAEAIEKIDTLYKQQFYLANKFAKSNSSMLQMTPFSKEDLKNLNIPVLVLVGDHDVINSEDSLEKAKELLPKSKAEEIKNAGHFLTIDQAKLVNKKIMDFLN